MKISSMLQALIFGCMLGGSLGFYMKSEKLETRLQAITETYKLRIKAQNILTAAALEECEKRTTNKKTRY